MPMAGLACNCSNVAGGAIMLTAASVVMRTCKSCLCCRGTSPLSADRRSVGLVSGKGGYTLAKMHQFKVSASQVSVSALERRHGLTRLACASCWLPRGEQRSRAGSPASRRALCASGRATDTTAYQCATVWVVSQSARRSTAMPRPLASARCRIVLAAR